MGKGPKAYGGSPAMLWLYVQDCDALFNRAVAAGASVANGPIIRPPVKRCGLSDEEMGKHGHGASPSLIIGDSGKFPTAR
jgi:hypothetical protein